MSQVKQMVGISSSTYTGDNIKIGVIDSGYPLDNDKIYDNIVAHNTYGDENSQTLSDNYHTSKVLNIICDIAPNADIYLTSFYKNYYNPSVPYSLGYCVDWLIDCGVNIINMSQTAESAGSYTGHCAYIDYIVANNNVLFVKSAGNEGATKYVTSPGAGLNVLTVGSVCPAYNISSFSSYLMRSSYGTIINKPNIVAPGEFLIPLSNSNKFDYGTSFAAPIVTGIAALLMEEFTNLKTQICKTIALLMASAYKIPSQTSVCDTQCGSGIVNYNYARQLMNSGNVEYFFNDLELSGEMVGDFTFYMDSNNKQLTIMSMSYNYFNLTSDNAISNVSNYLNSTSYSLKIYDTNYNLIRTYGGFNNFYVCELNLPIGSYYIGELIMNTTRPSDYEDRITIIFDDYYEI